MFLKLNSNIINMISYVVCAVGVPTRQASVFPPLKLRCSAWAAVHLHNARNCYIEWIANARGQDIFR